MKGCWVSGLQMNRKALRTWSVQLCRLVCYRLGALSITPLTQLTTPARLQLTTPIGFYTVEPACNPRRGTPVAPSCLYTKENRSLTLKRTFTTSRRQQRRENGVTTTSHRRRWDTVAVGPKQGRLQQVHKWVGSKTKCACAAKVGSTSFHLSLLDLPHFMSLVAKP